MSLTGPRSEDSPDGRDLVLHAVDHLDDLVSRSRPVLDSKVFQSTLLASLNSHLESLSIEALKERESVFVRDGKGGDRGDVDRGVVAGETRGRVAVGGSEGSERVSGVEGEELGGSSLDTGEGWLGQQGDEEGEGGGRTRMADEQDREGTQGVLPR
jgi:hypothetical protein